MHHGLFTHSPIEAYLGRFQVYFFIYLAVLGLSCSMWGLVP